VNVAPRFGPLSTAMAPPWALQIALTKLIAPSPATRVTMRFRVSQSLPKRDPGAIPSSGRVADKGLSDELVGGFYAVVETPTRCAYHVPLDGMRRPTQFGPATSSS
jgi:hypothetical protein